MKNAKIGIFLPLNQWSECRHPSQTVKAHVNGVLALGKKNVEISWNFSTF